MTQQEKAGSHLIPNLRNLYRCLDLFESYTGGSLYGLCLLAQPEDAEEPVGAVMAGELSVPDTYDTTLGKLATLWGVYVDTEFRGRGLGVKLFQEALKVGLEMGFDSVETYVLTGNEHGRRVARAFGTQPYAEQRIVSLRDPSVLNNDEAREALAREANDG
jgi:ribosomal protein S18 acetylase RimI-like enzyme